MASIPANATVQPRVRVPRRLPSPATIGLCALSGRVDEAQLGRAVGRLQGLGHRVVVPDATKSAWRYFAGEDDARLAAFDSLLADDAIDLIMSARGGYGLSRLLDRIDWARVAASGKIFVGFSDFTAFNLAAYARAGYVTFHGPMAAVDFGNEKADEFAQRNFWSPLSHDRHRIDDIACEHGQGEQRIEGTLWGGNLALLSDLVGTPFFPSIANGILYVEDIAEEPYAIERMFMHLIHAGVFERQKAVVLGDFDECKPVNTARYPYSMAEVLETLRDRLPCPLFTGLPFGHVARKVTLPFGAAGELSLRPGGYSLSFSGHVR